MSPAPDNSSPGDHAQPTTNEHADRGRRWISWCVAVVAIPILYVLSCGPALWICARLNLHPICFDYPYSPVIWLAKNTALKDPLTWYAELWLPH